MKFNRTLSFDASRELDRKQDASIANLSAQHLQQLDSLEPGLRQDFSPSFVGLAGVFIPLKNDFTPTKQANGQQGSNGDAGAAEEGDDDDEDEMDEDEAELGNRPRYSDAPEWPREKREKVKRFRFIICSLALFGVSCALMSRLMLNVSIVEMVKKQPDLVINEEVTTAKFVSNEMSDFASSTQDSSLLMGTLDPLMFAATYDSLATHDTATQASAPEATTLAEVRIGPESTPGSGLGGARVLSVDEEEDDGVLRFDWSKQEVNLVIGSFYMGYMPGILLSGDFAQRYGAKYPLLICIFGSALINIATPTIAGISLNLMIGSRVLLGLIQGSLAPAMYELFNRWLTKTESSIFAPLIKVTTPLGALIGTLMPGLLARYKLPWTLLFYFGGLLCCLWSVVWLLVATSLPQTNRFVEQSELNRIMRKKSAALKIIELPAPSQQTVIVVEPSGEKGRRSLSKAVPQLDFRRASTGAARRKTPWLKIVTNPSVLVLTLVKFTYNIGLDFVFLQLAVYLREAHRAPIETISAIASSAYLVQMIFIAFVGWLAKTLVLRRTFGLSVTKWRKIFQGGANFTMSICFLLLAYCEPNIRLASALILANCFFWMLGAGGESMIPYDLSTRFTAPIVGFTHSVAISSGIALTAIVGVVLGEHTQEASRWSLLFAIIGWLLAAGGFVFVLVLKSKPFLAAEKQRAREQAAAAAASKATNKRPEKAAH